MNTINWLAVIVAAVSAFALGAIWYSPILFMKPWRKDNNFTEGDIKKGNKGKIFGISFVLTLIMAVNLAMFLNGNPDLDIRMGALYGLLAGVWVFCGIGIIGLFEHKAARYIFINGGYCLVALGLMGAILGAWR
jgi:presenilin-like A22 family membrane protease